MKILDFVAPAGCDAKSPNRRRQKRPLPLLLASSDCWSLLDQLGIVSITDKKGRITYVNDAFVSISGYAREELLGQNHRILNSGHHPAEFFHEMYRTLAHRKVWRAPVKNRRKDGTFYWVDALIVPLIDSGGRVKGYISVRLDITSAVKSHIDLDERNRLLNGVLENFPGGIAVYDTDLRMTVCNERQKELLEYPDHLFSNGMPTLEDLVRFNARRGEYGDGDVDDLVKARMELARQFQPHSFVRVRPNGKYLEVKGAPLGDGGFVSIHMDVTERQRDQATIEALAHHDVLTGLANRRLLRDRLQVALARVKRGDKLAVLYLDLDRFKTVNDIMGHPVGDALLQAVALRLKKGTRATDTVARLGGDEFAILQIGPKSAANVATLAARLIKTISAPHEIGGQTLSIGTSIGIAMAPTDSTDADELLKSADLALYQVKADGRGHFRFFEPQMNERVQARCIIENGLRSALERDEFELHYQPIVCTESRRVTSCEALLRWHHPKMGPISPSAFIPVAEDSGLIVPIGDWVLKKACQDARSWPEHINVSVNMSVAQFRSRDLYTMVLDALEGFDPARLILEITETTLMQSNEETIERMTRLQSLGVRFALDDFGTGYSSLGYLQKFPFDKIKIDRSFIATAGNNARAKTLLSAIANLGKALNMQTIAEGIETDADLANVKAQGCTEAQGYLFSRAIPARQLHRLFESSL
ncbi:MAG: GGDEF domain-containing protein [Hyphomicrobium sp.]|nr:MAG: GGDEF domain-containing protein [Hyphomicrobium sp.]